MRRFRIRREKNAFFSVSRKKIHAKFSTPDFAEFSNFSKIHIWGQIFDFFKFFYFNVKSQKNSFKTFPRISDSVQIQWITAKTSFSQNAQNGHVALPVGQNFFFLNSILQYSIEKPTQFRSTSRASQLKMHFFL